MQIRLQFKTPDVVFYATEFTDESTRAEIVSLCSRWVKFGENITVIVDTEEQTATVEES